MFSKSVDTELDRLDRLLAAQEAKVRAAFAEFVRDAKSEAVIKAAADALEAGDIQGALRVVDGHINRLAAVFPQIYNDTARAELPHIAGALAELVPVVAVSFDPTDARAALQMRANQLTFIQQFTDAQRNTTRQALVASLQSGTGTQGQATAFRDSIGLTAKQEAAVRNYRRLLEQGSQEALSRRLRDRRYDRTVQRAIAGGEPLSQDQVDRMVARYRARFLAYRAETIARTETGRTVEQAREEALRQNLAATAIPDQAVDQTWRTTMDGRERDTHHTMNGQVQPLGSAFLSPSGALIRWPGDSLAPPLETIQCRCHRTFRIRGSAISRAA